jgi:anthranilate synthase/aminodeoxychorismate synthase-like glutamine amidotransferase
MVRTVRDNDPVPRQKPREPKPHATKPRVPKPRVLVIDNYDSFVYNLVQYLGELGAQPEVHRHDAMSLAELRALEPDAVLISPGPGRPSDAGLSNEAIRAFGESGTPVLGVCLGLQCIGELYGGSVVRAPHVMHGKTSEIRHSGAGVFEGLPDPFTATRYHSLVVARETVPDSLEITAESEDGLVMGLRHRGFPIEGVQFHPESILTIGGHRLLANFLAGATATGAPGEGVPARA